MIRRRTCWGLLALCFMTTAWAQQAETQRKPNVLLIYTDDHGWADLGLQGVDPDVRTPHIDQLARDGVRFTRGYVSAPQCVPSRAGLLTGRYQQKFGLEDNNKGPLPLAEVTLAERLKPAGYVSGFVGKSHLDLLIDPAAPQKAKLLPTHLPPGLGFDEYFCGQMHRYHASHDLQGKPLAKAPRIVTDSRFRVQVQTEAALSFLDRRAKDPASPWFLYLSWFAPHVPLESPEPWFSRTPAHLPVERRQALAMIAAMDEGVGAIREKLRTMHQDTQTMIFFISDNGAPLKAGAWDGSLNQPLIGEKGMLTDGGIRVPFLFTWPGRIPAGKTYDHPVINLDVAATAHSAAGLRHDARLDGVDLLPYLNGKNTAPPDRQLFWRWRSQAAVLDYPWKLILVGDQGRYLFNVTRPEGELAQQNLIDQHPEMAESLQKKLFAWCDQLTPPGKPLPRVPEDEKFYEAHCEARPNQKNPR